MSLWNVSAQAFKIAHDGIAVGYSHHLSVCFKESVNAVRSFAERPGLPRFHENLPEKEVPHGTIQKCKHGTTIWPHEPFFRNNRARLASALIYMSISMPWNSASDFPENGS